MRILLKSPPHPPFNSGLGNAVAQPAVRAIYHPDHTPWQLLDALVTLGVVKPARVKDE